MNRRITSIGLFFVDGSISTCREEIKSHMCTSMRNCSLGSLLGDNSFGKEFSMRLERPLEEMEVLKVVKDLNSNKAL